MASTSLAPVRASTCALSIGSLFTSSRARSLARSRRACRRPARWSASASAVALGALVLGDQRLPVGDRDLIVVGMDFAEGQKAVAIAAVVDEGGLQRRLDPRHLGQIDVAAKLFAVR